MIMNELADFIGGKIEEHYVLAVLLEEITREKMGGILFEATTNPRFPSDLVKNRYNFYKKINDIAYREIEKYINS